jgi:16S rRNA (guanine(527)-N(7))-methyltransferase RsmG
VHIKKKRPSNLTDPGPAQMSDLLKRCGIFLTAPQLNQLWSYHGLIRAHNPELNLTRIHSFENMVIKLYADSIIPGQLTQLPSPLMDLGSGAGMPGIPLKIAYPHLQVFLAESRQRRVSFLEKVCDRLHLDHLQVIGRTITDDFERPMAAVISRAVESIDETLARIQGCLLSEGWAVFMKGPNCEPEIELAVDRFGDAFRLVLNLSYSIPNTPHHRRLVVFERISKPLPKKRAEAMKRFSIRHIDSERNDVYIDLKKLLSTRGIRKQNRALLAGGKQVEETLRDFPERCEAWISSGDQSPPPEWGPDGLLWYGLAPKLFTLLDLFGTNSPLLLIKLPAMEEWRPEQGFPQGCTLLVPFQDPENVGALIRSAVAFGVTQVVLLAECAHPYLPKSLRASGGAVLRAKLLQGPALKDLTGDLPLVPLSMHGRDISDFTFPDSFGLLPGLEGPGIPEPLRRLAVSIPIDPRVESLNAATAAAVALYVWSRRSTPAGSGTAQRKTCSKDFAVP